MNKQPFSKEKYYSITELTSVLGASFKTVQARVKDGAIKPDYIAPITGKKYFLKEAIQQQYLTQTA